MMRPVMNDVMWSMLMSFPIVVCNYNKRGGHTQEKTSKNIKKMIFLSGRFRVGAGTPCDQAPHTHY